MFKFLAGLGVALTGLLLLGGWAPLKSSPDSSWTPRDYLTVLSLNLKGHDPNYSREERLRPVVELCRAEKVDVLLLQEGVAGLVVRDSIKELQGQLGLAGRTKAPVFGVWPFMTYEIGVLSRFPFNRTVSAGCGVSMVPTLDKLPIPGKRRIVGGHFQVPGLGAVKACSVHLASKPLNQEERMKQVTCLLAFISEQSRPDLEILGGDFNFRQNNPAYGLVQAAGFQGFGSGVDFVFCRGGEVYDGKSVFTDHFVSDHCGILVKIRKGKRLASGL
jgi:endonuclease/exonuclease/phosphatase family metal-dependent hydrolase